MIEQLSIKSSQRVQTSAKADPDDFLNLIWTFLSKDTYLVKFSQQSNPEVWAKLWENAIACNVEEFFVDPGLGADDFQILTVSS